MAPILRLVRLVPRFLVASMATLGMMALASVRLAIPEVYITMLENLLVVLNVPMELGQGLVIATVTMSLVTKLDMRTCTGTVLVLKDTLVTQL